MIESNVTEFETMFQEHVNKYFRAFVRFQATDKGNHGPTATFKRWWIAKGPTRLTMINEKGQKVNMLSKLKIDVWNKYKEVV